MILALLQKLSSTKEASKIKKKDFYMIYLDIINPYGAYLLDTARALGVDCAYNL